MLLTTLIWAGNIAAGKIALEGFSALALAQLRMSTAALLYVVVYIAARGLPPLRRSRREWLYLATMAVFGITLNQVFYIGGLSKTSVTHAGLIQAMGPVVVLLFSAASGLEMLSWSKLCGMAISFLGVAVLLVERPATGSGAHWSGDLILLAAIGVFSTYTILMKKVATQYDPLTLNVLVFSLGAIFLLPVGGPFVARVVWTNVPLRAWLGFGFMVLFGSFTAYLMFAFALERLSASSVAAFYYLQPVIAALLGVWLLAERISWPVLAGGALILGGLYVTERGRGASGQWPVAGS